MWGLDLSQSLQGAGGIGGLLVTVDGSTPFLFHHHMYDGNGNVGQLVDVSDGSIDAQYEYDPYGNAIIATGILANSNPYRFSTKYLDSEYGLYYYGYRYNEPATGRWLSRDPIEEDGGINLYGFVMNSPIIHYDVLGEWVNPNGVASPTFVFRTVRTTEQGMLGRYMSEAKKLRNKKQWFGLGGPRVPNERKWTLDLLWTLGREVFDTNDVSGTKNKWVFTCKYGWLDMGHFFTVSWLATKLNDSGRAYTLSTWKETEQDVFRKFFENSPHGQSGGTAEDLYSNYLGANFNHGGIGLVAVNFNKMLHEAGAVKHTKLGGVDVFSILQNDAKSLWANDKSEIYTGERHYTKEKQLNYQKNALEGFCELCDGDKPKKGFEY
ncbi:MAG: RHS repeat domain-containing protein [Candidatus Omnitrophota bacterium]